MQWLEPVAALRIGTTPLEGRENYQRELTANAPSKNSDNPKKV